jgi:hypothetical protein
MIEAPRLEPFDNFRSSFFKYRPQKRTKSLCLSAEGRVISGLARRLNLQLRLEHPQERPSAGEEKARRSMKQAPNAHALPQRAGETHPKAVSKLETRRIALPTTRQTGQQAAHA